MIKPVAYMNTDDDGYIQIFPLWYYNQINTGKRDTSRDLPLYAIPEGYHIVAIDHEQEMLDNIEQHNERVRANAKAD